ncbi:MAG: hypothetical protein VX435_01575 [Planctomycetota bacterium]|nr:hypothetical protein [Planctomycetota bacterium]
MKFFHYILVVPVLLIALEHSSIAQTDNNAGTDVAPSQRQQERRNGRLGRRHDRPRFARSHPLMQALDTDKDGNLSKAEIEKATVSLSTLDKNGDGDLTHEEISPFIGRESRRAGNGRGERGRRFRGRGGRRAERRRRPNRPGSDYADSRSRRRGPDGERRRSRGDRRRPDGPEGRQREDRRRNRFERGGPESRQPRGLERQNPEQMMRRFLSLDKNGDEKLSREELAELQGLVERWDQDGDGALNKLELRDIIQRRMQEGERRRSRGDRNGPEGRQREDRRRNRFERGGPESRQPRGLGRPNPEQMLRRFLSLDKNGDDKVSREEMPDRLQGMLQRFDKDGDGALSEQELKEAIKRRLRGQQNSNAPSEDNKKSEDTEQKPEDTSVTS